MFFRLPVVRFFNRVINRATVTVALVLLQIGWLLWAFFSLTAGKVWVNAGLSVLSLFITLYLVRKDENSDYKIIWLVLIGMMPLLGGALYLAFGNKAPAKRMRQRMQAVERQHTADLAQQPGQTDALDPASRGLSRYVSEYGPYPAWKNSTAKYYPCGEAMYPDLLADLEKAERFIFLEFFIVRTGKMWKGVEDILVRKAAQGVDVRLIYDDFGSLLGLPSDFVVQMERAHIRCIPFNPVVPLVSLVMNHRDHRKIVVVDGNTAYTGGINLADEYINEEERFGYWKDAALRTEGAAVWNFTVMFLDHWNAFRPSEEDYAPFMPQAESLSAQSDGVIQPYGDSPLDEEALAETVYLNIINQETLICGDGFEVSGSNFNFNSPVEVGDAVVGMGFNVITMCNNHLLDKGESGLNGCLNYWDQKMQQYPDILACGVYRDYVDMQQHIRTKEFNGKTVAFLSYTENTNGYSLPDNSELEIVYTSQEDIIQQQIAAAKEIADVVVVTCHWGVEDTYNVTDGVKALAQKIIDWGGDVIIGTHPHVAQTMEYLTRPDGTQGFVFYSLGNFISAQTDNMNLIGELADFNIVAKEDGSVTIEDVKVSPVITQFDDGRESNLRLYPYSMYTDELAAQHGLPYCSSSTGPSYQVWSMEKIRELFDTSVPEQFRNYN